MSRNIVFISHCGKDATVAEMIKDYLVRTGIPDDQIFCSSVPGNDVREQICSEVREQLKKTSICILILSEDFYKSAYCLNEAGIAWYHKDIRVIPIALPEIDQNNMQGFMNSDYILRRPDRVEDMSFLYEQVQGRLKTKSASPTTIIRETKKLSKQYNGFVSKREKTGQDVSRKDGTNVEDLSALEKENRELKTEIARLKNEESQKYRQEYKKLKDEALYRLAFYANAYTNIVTKPDKWHDEASESFRDIASRFDAFFRGIQQQYAGVPSIEELKEVSACLFGLSNSMYYHSEEGFLRQIENNEKMEKTIREILSRY